MRTIYEREVVGEDGTSYEELGRDDPELEEQVIPEGTTHLHYCGHDEGKKCRRVAIS